MSAHRKSLGKVPASGKLDANNPVFPGGWTITFTPADIGIRIESEMYHAAVKGPASSQFQVFIGDTFYDNVVRGDINSFDPSQPMLVSPDDTIYFYYNTASGTAPKATLFFREPSQL